MLIARLNIHLNILNILHYNFRHYYSIHSEIQGPSSPGKQEEPSPLVTKGTERAESHSFLGLQVTSAPSWDSTSAASENRIQALHQICSGTQAERGRLSEES